MGLLDNIGKFLSDEENQLNLASGFAGMSGNPNAGNIQQGYQNRLIALRSDNKLKTSKDEAADKLKKRTAMALQILGNKHPKISSLLISGFLTPNEAIIESNKTPTERKMFKGADNFNYYTDDQSRVLPDAKLPSKERKTGKDQFGVLRYLDDGTQAFATDPNSPLFNKEQLGNINALRDDLTKDLNQFSIIKQGYKNIMNFFKEPNQVTDYAIAVAFAKVLDPGSVAREGEVNAINNAGAKIPAFQAAFKNAIAGTGKMDAKMRYDIATAASALYEERAGEAINSIDKYDSLGLKGGIPKGNIYLGAPVTQPTAIPPWLVPDGMKGDYSQDQWAALPYKDKVDLIASFNGQ